MQQLADALHENLGRRCRFRERVTSLRTSSILVVMGMSRILTQSERFTAVEDGTPVIWRIPSVLVKQFGMDRKGQGIKPAEQRGSRRVEVFIPNAVDPGAATQREFPASLRSATIFSSGTRSPAPHQAAIKMSGSMPATSSAEICCPGVPRNSPPAASTSSATQGCDAISGLPHSSQKTLRPR